MARNYDMMDDIGGVADAIRKARIEKFQALILARAKEANEAGEDGFYSDEIDFDSLLSGDQSMAGKHPSMVGIAFRLLESRKLIHKTGQFARSSKKGSRGRTIFQYAIGES